MLSTVVLVTGANSGIGLETVKALYGSKTASQPPYAIILCGRSLDKANRAAEGIRASFPAPPQTGATIEAVQLDIADDASIEALHAYVAERYGHVNVLINNAGINVDLAIDESRGTTDVRRGWSETLEVNVTSTHVMTHAFADLVVRAPLPNRRILFVTSGLGSLHDASHGLPTSITRPERGWPKKKAEFAFPAYRTSKAAVNMVMLEWQRILAEDEVTVHCIAPGLLATNLGGVGEEAMRSFGAGHPSLGGELIRDVVEGKRDQDKGKSVRRNEEVQSW